MSWLMQVDKTIDHITQCPDEILLFIRPASKIGNQAKRTWSIESKEVSKLTFGEIINLIRDPGYILIKIDEGALE